MFDRLFVVKIGIVSVIFGYFKVIRLCIFFFMFLFMFCFLIVEIIDIFVGFYMMKMFFMNICVILLVIVEKCKLNECIIVFYDLIKIL